MNNNFVENAANQVERNIEEILEELNKKIEEKDGVILSLQKKLQGK